MATGNEYSLPLARMCQRPLPAMIAPGWFTCYCGCGSVGVCRHCVPNAPVWVPWQLCQVAQLLIESGQYRCREGWLEVVGDA